MFKKSRLSTSEILISLAITMIVGFVLWPVILKVRDDSQAKGVGKNLKGFWQSLMIYREQNTPLVDYGPIDQMGLPMPNEQWLNFVNHHTGDYTNGFQTKQAYLPCGQLDKVGMESIGLFYMAGNVSDWARDAAKYQGGTVVLMDANCNPPGTKWLNQTMMKQSYGVTLDGQIRSKRSKFMMPTEQRFYQLDISK